MINNQDENLQDLDSFLQTDILKWVNIFQQFQKQNQEKEPNLVVKLDWLICLLVTFKLLNNQLIDEKTINIVIQYVSVKIKNPNIEYFDQYALKTSYLCFYIDFISLIQKNTNLEKKIFHKIDEDSKQIVRFLEYSVNQLLDSNQQFENQLELTLSIFQSFKTLIEDYKPVAQNMNKLLEKLFFRLLTNEQCIQLHPITLQIIHNLYIIDLEKQDQSLILLFSQLAWVFQSIRPDIPQDINNSFPFDQLFVLAQQDSQTIYRQNHIVDLKNYLNKFKISRIFKYLLQIIDGILSYLESQNNVQIKLGYILNVIELVLLSDLHVISDFMNGRIKDQLIQFGQFTFAEFTSISLNLKKNVIGILNQLILITKQISLKYQEQFENIIYYLAVNFYSQLDMIVPINELLAQYIKIFRSSSFEFSTFYLYQRPCVIKMQDKILTTINILKKKNELKSFQIDNNDKMQFKRDKKNTNKIKPKKEFDLKPKQMINDPFLFLEQESIDNLEILFNSNLKILIPYSRYCVQFQESEENVLAFDNLMRSIMCNYQIILGFSFVTVKEIIKLIRNVCCNNTIKFQENQLISEVEFFFGKILAYNQNFCTDILKAKQFIQSIKHHKKMVQLTQDIHLNIYYETYFNKIKQQKSLDDLELVQDDLELVKDDSEQIQSQEIQEITQNKPKDDVNLKNQTLVILPIEQKRSISPEIQKKIKLNNSLIINNIIQQETFQINKIDDKIHQDNYDNNYSDNQDNDVDENNHDLDIENLPKPCFD